VVVADASKRLRVIGTDRNALLMDLAAPFRIRLLRSSRDGGRLVTISTATEQVPPVLWDLDRYRPVGPLEGHVGRVFTARFVAVEHGIEILTTGSDGTARTWDAATGQPRETFLGDYHFLADAALSPDGSMIVAGGSDGVLRVWSRSSGRLLWMLRAHALLLRRSRVERTGVVRTLCARQRCIRVAAHYPNEIQFCESSKRFTTNRELER
jgi:WD40 repeat protein